MGGQTRERAMTGGPALPADMSPPPSAPEQPAQKAPRIPPLHFPEQPAGEGPAPAPGAPDSRQGGYAGEPPGAQAPQPQDAPPGDTQGQRADGRCRRPSQAGSRPPEPAVRQRAIVALLLGTLSLVALLGLGSDFHRGLYLLIFSCRWWRSLLVRDHCAAAGTARRDLAPARGDLRHRVRRDRLGAQRDPAHRAGGVLDPAIAVLSVPCRREHPSAQQACRNQLNKSVNGEIARIGAGG